jgi:hypothetical protein
MSENDVREGLRGVVDGEPPLSFDPDELMETTRRRTKRRRALVSVGVATTAVAVAAVAVPLALGIQRGTGEVAAGAQPGTAVSTTVPPSSPPEAGDIPWPPPGVVPAHYTAAELTQRGEEMRAHLSSTFASVVPGASGVEVQPFGGESTGSVSDGQTYLNAFTKFSVAGAPYAVDLQAIAPGAAVSPEEQCGDHGACEARELADGTWLLITEEGQDQATIVSVIHYRANGAVVRATGYNYDPTSQTAVQYAPAVPVTVDQLAALATDTALFL